MRFILGLIIGILVVIFIFQNTEVVDITFLFWTLSASRAIMVFVVFIFDIIFGYILKDADEKLKAKNKKKK